MEEKTMAYNILLTSLHSTGKDERIRYFRSVSEQRTSYCDAILTVEASTKYALAHFPIDEIITLGQKLTYDEGDDGRLIRLTEGKTFYTADIGSLSTYSLYRYRIAQYIDELKIEQQAIMEKLDEEHQGKMVRYIRDFYQREKTEEKYRKFNRLFDELARDPESYKQFRDIIKTAARELDCGLGTCYEWAGNYLYCEMKDTMKLELLRGNEAVKVRFIPTYRSAEGTLPMDHMISQVLSIVSSHEEGVNLYVALNNDDQTDNFVLLNILDMIKALPKSRVNIRNILTVSFAEANELSGEIRDDTESFRITELVVAARTFLQYGRADLIVDFWEKSGAHNERIEQMIYAMRRIDMGISMCNIAEIENGIDELRELFSGGTDLGGQDYYSKLYGILVQGLLRDYGPLLEGDEIEFIDLVKWAFSKKFYQQTLTIIESRAPEVFVKRGIFCYCADIKQKEHTAVIFSRIRGSMKDHQRYQMEDVDHYYIKLFGRKRYHRENDKDPQKHYAACRIEELKNTDPERITAFSVCEDKEALQNLLHAYYHIGEIRNITNHAMGEETEDDRLIVDHKDIPFQMSRIREAIEYFIISYEEVAEKIKDRRINVVRITGEEVKAAGIRATRSGNKNGN